MPGTQQNLLVMECAECLYTGKRHHCNLFQCLYQHPKCIRVVLGKAAKSTRKVRWDICSMRPAMNLFSIGAHLRWKHSLNEGQIVLSMVHVVAKVGKSGCSMANANQLVGLGFHSDAGSEFIKLSYGQNLVHGEGTSLSRVGPYRFCSGSTLDKPSWGYRLRYRFRLGPYPFCSDGNPTTLSILLWSYLILPDIQMESCSKPGLSCYVCLGS